jgi:hypothetical protein
MGNLKLYYRQIMHIDVVVPAKMEAGAYTSMG